MVLIDCLLFGHDHEVVSVRKLVDEKSSGPQQMNLFENPERRERVEKLEHLKDELHRKFGPKVLLRPR